MHSPPNANPRQQLTIHNINACLTATGTTDTEFTTAMRARGHTLGRQQLRRLRHGQRKLTLAEALDAADFFGYDLTDFCTTAVYPRRTLP